MNHLQVIQQITRLLTFVGLFFSTSGAPSWLVSTLGGDKLAEANSLNGGFAGAQSLWMMTPEITYASTNVLSFSSAVKAWNHDGLEVYLLNNYSGGDPSSSSPILVSGATIAGSSSTDNTLVPSGNISLSSFGISGTYRVAFKYSANPGAGQTSTYKIDNVVISQ